MTSEGETENDDLQFDLKMIEVEDVNGCLERFLLTSKLDHKDEARAIAHDILWRYIHFFPVFAELCEFYIIESDSATLTELLLEHLAKGTAWDDPKQSAFVQMASHYAKGTLFSDTLGRLQSDLQPHVCDSQAEVHNIEIRLRNSLRDLDSYESMEALSHVNFFELCQAWVKLWASKLTHRSVCQVLLALCKTRTISVQSMESLFATTRDMFSQLREIAFKDEDLELQIMLSQHLFFQAQGYAEALGLRLMPSEQENDIEKQLMSLMTEEEAYTSQSSPPTVSSKNVPARAKSPMVPKDDSNQATPDDPAAVKPPASPIPLPAREKNLPVATDQRSRRDLELADTRGELVQHENDSGRIESRLHRDGYINITDAKVPTRIQRQFADVLLYDGRSEINMRRNFGSCNIWNQRGEVNIRRVAGDVSMFDTNGEVNIRRVAGDVSMFDTNGDIRIFRTNGPCSIFDTQDAVSVHRSQGNVELIDCNGQLNVLRPQDRCYLDQPALDVDIKRPMSTVHLTECYEEIHISSSTATIYFHGTQYSVPGERGFSSEVLICRLDRKYETSQPDASTRRRNMQDSSDPYSVSLDSRRDYYTEQAGDYDRKRFDRSRNKETRSDRAREQDRELAYTLR